ncbi:MAG TPA: glutathione S-transferase family protein [Stellaceae bacterium]|nr:glutathione S-transferase family protein [Stellaceae bacterium]
MAITMYDLAGVEAERRFSPFCWRARMALAHKGLDVETVPWRFIEKDKLPTPNDGRVPVIIDDGKVIHDSSAIADYLEERYPDRPSLFPGEAARGLSKFVQNWTETVLQVGLVRLVVLDIWKHIGPKDQEYFRQSREARFGGMSLEDVVKDRDTRLPAFRASLDPLRRTIERQPFVCGAAPAYGDYVVFGAFQWARSISDFELVAADDAVFAWRGRMLDLYGGLGRRSPGYGG